MNYQDAPIGTIGTITVVDHRGDFAGRITVVRDPDGWRYRGSGNYVHEAALENGDWRVKQLNTPNTRPDLEVGDQIVVHGKVFVLTEFQLKHGEPPFVEFESVAAQLERRLTSNNG